MPQALNDWSPWMRALTSISDDPADGAPGGITEVPTTPNSAVPPAHRIEDDRTAGTRGVTPQPDTPKPTLLGRRAQSPGQAPGNDTGFYVGATHPQVSGAATLPLERELTTERAELNRMNQPTKMTLKDRLRGALLGAAGGAAGMSADTMATLRDRVVARKQAERESLENRIAANTRSLSEEGMRAQAQIAAAERLGQTLSARERVAGEQIQGREDVAEMRGQVMRDIESSRESAAGGRLAETLANKAETRVMGDKTYQFMPATNSWKEIGPAPANVTRQPTEPGNYQPVVNAAGETVGWVDPKSGGFKPVGSIPGVSEAASGTAGAPLPMKPSGQTASRMQQGDAIQTAGNNLIADINKYRDKLGQWSNFWQSLVKGTPIADPDLRYMGNQLMSFAALQPAAHGARGLQAIQAFEKAVGGTPENPDALIRGIQGIQRGLQPLRPATPQSPSPAAPKSPKSPLTSRTPSKAAADYLKSVGVE